MIQPLLFGVPQGSVLGHLLYVLYTAELGCKVATHDMYLHQYVDDSQVYIPVTVSNTVAAVHSFAACISDINDWMRASTLRLNPAKTQVVLLDSPQQLRQVDITDIQALSTKIKVVKSARNLAVTIDRQLSQSAHVTALCRSGCFQLRQLRPAVRSLTIETAKTLIQAFRFLLSRLLQLIVVSCV